MNQTADESAAVAVECGFDGARGVGHIKVERGQNPDEEQKTADSAFESQRREAVDAAEEKP